MCEHPPTPAEQSATSIAASLSPKVVHDQIDGRNWSPAIQLAHTVPSITLDQATVTEERGILTPMAVKHTGALTYKVQDEHGQYTVNLRNSTCSCCSLTLAMGGRCEHLWHLIYRDQENHLPKSTTRKSTILSPHSSPVTPTEHTVPVACENCATDIGKTTASVDSISVTRCTSCAETDSRIREFHHDPDANGQLVYVNDLIYNGTAATYYPETSSMNVYEFFKSHPETSPDDNVARVAPRLTHDRCTGLVFEDEQNPVPTSLLTEIEQPITSPTTTMQTQTQSQDSMETA